MGDLLLFHFPGSVHSKAVRLALEEKELEWESRPLNTLMGEEFEPWYVEDINGTCSEPALIHENKAINTAHYICLYLERNFTDIPLLPPEGTVERAVAEQWFDMLKEFPPEPLYHAHSGGWRLQLALDNLEWQHQQLERFALEHPALASYYIKRADSVEALYTRMRKPNAIAEGLQEVTGLLDSLDAQLQSSGGRFVAGDEYSLADVAWTAFLHDLQCCDLSCLWTNGRRWAVQRYYRRMRDRPSHDTALEDFPVTVEFVLPYYFRIFRKKVLGSRKVWVAMATAVGAWFFLLRRPSTPPPLAPIGPLGSIMITFSNLGR